MLALFLSLALTDAFTPERIQADLLGQTVKVGSHDWTFAEGKGESTKVVAIKGFTPGQRKLTVSVELDCHLC